MTEFQELVKDAPEFALMERGELAIYAYAMYAAGVKIDAENAKLRELVADAWGYINHPADATWTHKKRKEVRDSIADHMRELGIEVK